MVSPAATGDRQMLRANIRRGKKKRGKIRLNKINARTVVPATILACSLLMANSAAAMPSEALLHAQVSPGLEVLAFHDWLLSCPAGEDAARCSFQPARPRVEGAAPVALVIASREGSASDLVLVLRSPLNALLPSGIAVTVDGRAVGRLAFQTCDQSGCIAPIRLEGQLADAIRRGSEMSATVTMRDGTPSTTRISLIGVVAGIAEWRRRR
jgi:invasion protein IalB